MNWVLVIVCIVLAGLVACFVDWLVNSYRQEKRANSLGNRSRQARVTFTRHHFISLPESKQIEVEIAIWEPFLDPTVIFAKTIGDTVEHFRFKDKVKEDIMAFLIKYVSTSIRAEHICEHVHNEVIEEMSSVFHEKFIDDRPLTTIKKDLSLFRKHITEYNIWWAGNLFSTRCFLLTSDNQPRLIVSYPSDHRWSETAKKMLEEVAKQAHIETVCTDDTLTFLADPLIALGELLEASQRSGVTFEPYINLPDND